jgi:hypothetical protein
MTETYKILGQVAPSGTTEQNLYTSPANTQALITNITVVNRTCSSQNFDISVANAPYSSLFSKYVAISSELSSSSTDGITWVSGSPPGAYFSAVAYGNGVFVAVSNYDKDYNASTIAAYSTNGNTWTPAVLPAAVTWSSVAYGNSTFVAVAPYTTAAASSTNGITWTLRTLPLNRAWNSLTYVNNIFYALASRESANVPTTTTAASSTDGITWTTRTMPVAGKWRAISFGNSTYVAVAGGYNSPTTSAASSTDGITWTTRTMPRSIEWREIAYGNGVFLALGYSQFWATSTNGITWTERSGNGWNSYSSPSQLIYSDNIFIGVGSTGANATSTDGITWTAITFPDYAQPSGIAYSNAAYTSPAVNNIYKNATVQANSYQVLQPGIVLGAQNAIVVKGTANTTFSVYGVELT